MLGKLIKYDFKATGRTFLLMYVSILILVVGYQLLGIAPALKSDIGGYWELVTGAVVIAMSVMSIYMPIKRYSENLLGDEGYLMFTLPVSIRKLIASKLIVAVIWGLCSALIGLFALFSLEMEIDSLQGFAQIGQEVWKNIVGTLSMEGNNNAWVIAFLMITRWVQMSVIILMFYVAIGIDRLATVLKGKGVWGMLFFFGVFLPFNSLINYIMSQAMGPSHTMGMGMSIFLQLFTAILVVIGVFEFNHHLLKNYLNLE